MCRSCVVIATALMTFGCSATRPPASGSALSSSAAATTSELSKSRLEPLPHADNVVLVTIDGVRWQEIFQGIDPELGARARLPRSRMDSRELVPNLYKHFIDGGTVLGPNDGEGIAAAGPN